MACEDLRCCLTIVTQAQATERWLIVRLGRIRVRVRGISTFHIGAHGRSPRAVQLQQGIQGILVLDARDGSPARLAGVHGTRRDQSGRLVLGDIISAFDGKKVK